MGTLPTLNDQSCKQLGLLVLRIDSVSRLAALLASVVWRALFCGPSSLAGPDLFCCYVCVQRYPYALANRVPPEQSCRKDRKKHPRAFWLVREAAADREEIVAESSPHSIRPAIGLPREFATTPLHQCKPSDLGLADLALKTSDYDTFVNFVGEDPTGRVERIALGYVQLGGITTEPDLDALFPLGTILVICKPTVETHMQFTRTSYIVRVPTPADYKILRLNDPFLKGLSWATSASTAHLPTSFDHKAEGNKHYKQKKYALALKAYCDGLAFASSLEQQLLLYLNRTQARLHHGNFVSALRDATAVSRLMQDDIEAPPRTV
ncbi:hypothetical protein JCM11641_008147 [Rhodosporidiobolus odoratus]